MRLLSPHMQDVLHTLLPCATMCVFVCVNGFWVLALYKEVYEFNIYILVRWPARLNSLFKLLFTHNVKSIVRWQKILAQNTPYIWTCVYCCCCASFIHSCLHRQHILLRSLHVFHVMKVRRAFFARLVNNHHRKYIQSETKWNELYSYMLAMLKMHLNTLIHSGNSCHLLGIKLFTFQFHVRSLVLLFSFLAFSFVLFKHCCIYIYWSRANWRQCWTHCGENCLLADTRNFQFYFQVAWNACTLCCW